MIFYNLYGGSVGAGGARGASGAGGFLDVLNFHLSSSTYLTEGL